jgi:hypothetical protein
MSSKAGRALKQFFAGYHEPAGLSVHQSEKLLDGLKSSFRNQLDREFGPSVARPSAAHSNHAAPTSGNRDLASMQHLKSVLSNPLFNQTPKHALDTSAEVPAEADPMRHFSQAMTKNLLTIRIATGCMIAKKNQLIAAGGLPALGTTNTGHRVVQWLRLSGRERDLDFLDNATFVEVLTRFLIAEGRHDVLWKWISQSLEHSSHATVADLSARRAANLLDQMARGRIELEGGSLDAAISTIQQAEDSFQKSPLLPQMLHLPWRSVSWLSTVQSSEHAHAKEDLFEAHVATADHLARPVPVETAHLRLLHPTQPDTKLALDLLHDKRALQKSVMVRMPGTGAGAPPGDHSNDMNIIAWIECLARDTAQVLAAAGSQEDARRLLERFGRLTRSPFTGAAASMRG